MRRYSNRGVVSLEEEGSSEVVAETTAPASVEAAEAEAEVTESTVDGDDIAADINEGVEVVEALESISDALAISAKNGGMDKYSAQVVGIATQYMYDRVGLRAKAMPSLESFGGSSTRIGATQLAMEGIKEKAKELWEYIVKAYKKIIAWATGHLRKLFGAAESMKKRAEAIAKSADDYRSKKVKDKTFDNAGLVKSLYVGNEVSAAKLKTSLTAIEGIAKIILDTKANEMVAQGEQIITAVETPGDNNSIGVVAKMVTTIKKPSDEFSKTNVDGGDMVWESTESLLGGFVWAERLPMKSGTTGLEQLSAFGKVKRGFMADGGKKPTKESLTTLTVDEVESTAEAVGKIAEILVDFKKTQDKLDQLLKKVVSAAEKMAKNADNTVDAESADATKDQAEKDHGKFARSALDNIKGFVLNTFVSASTYPLKTGQAALSYCEQSLKHYE